MSEFEIRIPIRATDEASPAFKDVTSAIIEMRKGSEKAREEFDKLHRLVYEESRIIRVLKEEAWGAGLTFNAYKDTLSKFGSVMSSINSIMTQWNTLQTRLNTAQIALNQAQEEYNDAVREFGPNSEQARRALEKLEEAQRKMRQAQTEASIQMFTLGANAINLVPRFMELYKSLSMLAAVKRIAAASATELATAQATSGAAGAASVAGHMAAAGSITAVGSAAQAASFPLALFKALLSPAGLAIVVGTIAAIGTAFASLSMQTGGATQSLERFNTTAMTTSGAIATASTAIGGLSASFKEWGITTEEALTKTTKNIAMVQGQFVEQMKEEITGYKTIVHEGVYGTWEVTRAQVGWTLRDLGSQHSQTFKAMNEEAQTYGQILEQIAYKAEREMEKIIGEMKKAEWEIENMKRKYTYAGVQVYGVEAQMIAEGKYEELGRLRRAGSAEGWFSTGGYVSYEGLLMAGGSLEQRREWLEKEIAFWKQEKEKRERLVAEAIAQGRTTVTLTNQFGETITRTVEDITDSIKWIGEYIAEHERYLEQVFKEMAFRETKARAEEAVAGAAKAYGVSYAELKKAIESAVEIETAGIYPKVYVAKTSEGELKLVTPEAAEKFGWEIVKIPAAQHGGVFTKPTLTLIAEKEPEAVIPLSKSVAFSAEPTIVIEHLEIKVEDGRDAARKLLDELSRLAYLRGEVTA
ncbi:MAG: hypothetical protein QXO01_01875 [Nitrososphaerota archaeon]